MKEEVLFKDVLPHIEIWSIAIILILSVFTYYIWRFGKKHPEIFEPDTRGEDKRELLRKAELRRQYHNKSLITSSTIFIWVIGIIIIDLQFNNFASTLQDLVIIAFAILAAVWILSAIKRKP